MPSISQVTTSPFFKNCGGVKPIPTPAGVPVAMIVPARSVMPRVSSAMISATEWIRWSVLLFCRFSPLTVEEIASAGGNATSSAPSV